VAAEYDTGDDNEVFTLDGLGNRESVNARDGNDITYDVNKLTNRYASVGESGLEYDAAGNLTKDRLTSTTTTCICTARTYTTPPVGDERPRRACVSQSA